MLRVTINPAGCKKGALPTRLANAGISQCNGARGIVWRLLRPRYSMDCASATVAEASSALMPTVDEKTSTATEEPGLGNASGATPTDTAALLPLWP